MKTVSNKVEEIKIKENGDEIEVHNAENCRQKRVNKEQAL